MCSLLGTKRSYVSIGWQILVYIQDIHKLWWFHLLHQYHQINFSMAVVNRCISTLSSQPFYSKLHHSYLSQLCFSSLQMHQFPFAGWWIDSWKNEYLEKLLWYPCTCIHFLLQSRTMSVYLVDHSTTALFPAELSYNLMSLYNSALQAAMG